MKRPSALTRLMAAPLIRLVLLVVCAAVFLGWLTGGVPWWLGFMALLTALRTLSAVGQVRRYKAWAARWQAMGEPINAPPVPPAPPQKKRGSRGLLTGAVLLVLAIPVLPLSSDAGLEGGRLLWCAACLYLAFRLIRGMMRRGGGKRHEERAVAQQVETKTPFVMWVMNRPSSSPSRAEAVRNLPDYCARVLAASSGRPRE